MVQYAAATKTRIWVSPAWEAAHPSVRQLLDRIIAQSDGRFTLVAGVAADGLRGESALRKHRGLLWAFATPAEKMAIDYNKAVTLAEFLCQIRRVGAP